ncbi:IclR family transcriptional regulator [Longispora albida]|uniref:IclR family transcriptional regulator n=1 Tax=Longispora albida TaxID=203523 RepID=UPI000367FCA2|nr:IclR family transcriptional regulator [Longispora albida]
MDTGPGDSGGPRVVSQVGRMVTIMDVVAHGPISLSKIVRRTGLPKVTVHRILGLLVVHGMIVRTEHGYVLGARPYRWADRGGNPIYTEVRQQITPYLVELHGKVRSATVLGVWSQWMVSYPERLFDHRQQREISPINRLAPAHATACGKALLAFDPQAAERFLSAPKLTGYTPSTITSPVKLASELRRIREEGIAVTRAEYHPGVHAVAAPVLDSRRRVFAAVGVAGPAERVRTPAVSSAVRAAAASISRELRGMHWDRI